MKKILFISLAVVLALSVGLIGCTAPSQQEEEEEEPEVKTLTIGCTLPLNTLFGVQTQRIIGILDDIFNEEETLVVQGQEYKLEHIIYDDAYDLDQAISNVQRLIHEDEVHSIYAIGSGPTKAVTPITEEAEMILMSSCLSSEFLMPPAKYTFKPAESAADRPAHWMKMRELYPEAEKIVFLGVDDESGHGDFANYDAVIAAAGPTPEAVWYPRDNPDFTPQAASIVAIDPDLVLIGACEGGTDLALMLKALYEAGYDGDLIYFEIPMLTKLKEICTNEMMEGLVCGVAPEEIGECPEITLRVKEEYIERYGEWTAFAHSFANPWFALLAAIRKADSLYTADIADAMQGLEYDTMQGLGVMVKRPDMGIDRYCDGVLDKIWGRIVNGEYVYVATTTAREFIEVAEEIVGGEWHEVY